MPTNSQPSPPMQNHHMCYKRPVVGWFVTQQMQTNKPLKLENLDNMDKQKKCAFSPKRMRTVSKQMEKWLTSLVFGEMQIKTTTVTSHLSKWLNLKICQRGWRDRVLQVCWWECEAAWPPRPLLINKTATQPGTPFLNILTPEKWKSVHTQKCT